MRILRQALTMLLSMVFFPLLMLSACQQSVPPSDLLRVGLAQLPMTLDPRYATDAASQKIQAFIHRGLIQQDEHFLPQADLAIAWQQPSATEWVFTLRQGVVFHDGTQLTAADVAATLQSILDPNNASPLRAGFNSIERIEILDEHRLSLHLSQADASLLTRLNIGILPKKQAMAGRHDGRIIGCGAFAVQSWQGEQLQLKRVRPSKQPEAINRIRFLRVKDAVTRVLKLSRGEIDFMQNDFPLHMLDFLQQYSAIHVRTAPSTTFSYIGINMQDPQLKDPRVRQALMLSIDRKKLKRALLRDTPILAETVLTASHWATASLPESPYDPQQAIQLLEQAGLHADAQGWRAHLTYRTSTNPERLQLATAIADQWRRIGLDVHVESLEWGAFYARIKRGDFQLFSLSWVGISDPDIYRWILHSQMWPPKGANRGRYKDLQVDQWLEAASQTGDITTRRRLYQQIQERMREDYVYLPLWYEPVVAVSGARLEGFVPQADAALTPLMQCKLQGVRR